MHTYEMLYHFNTNLGKTSLVQEVLFDLSRIGIVTRSREGMSSITVMDSATGENRQTLQLPIQSYKNIDLYDGKLLLHHPADRLIFFDLRTGASLGSCECTQSGTWLLNNSKKVITSTTGSVATTTSSGEALFRVDYMQAAESPFSIHSSGTDDLIPRIAIGSSEKLMIIMPDSSERALLVSLASGTVVSQVEFSADEDAVSCIHLDGSCDIFVGHTDGKVDVWSLG